MLDKVDGMEDSLIDTLKCWWSKFEKPLLLQPPTVPFAIGIITAVGVANQLGEPASKKPIRHYFLSNFILNKNRKQSDHAYNSPLHYTAFYQPFCYCTK